MIRQLSYQVHLTLLNFKGVCVSDSNYWLLLSGLDLFNVTIITVSKCLKRSSVQAFIDFVSDCVRF